MNYIAKFFRKSKVLHKTIVQMFLLLALESCSNSCKLQKDQHYSNKSVDKINSMIVESKYGSDIEPQLQNINKKRVTVKPMQLIQDTGFFVNEISDLKSSRIGVYRIPEKVIKIWVSGYETEDGNYVDAHNIFIVLKNSNWKERLKVQDQ